MQYKSIINDTSRDVCEPHERLEFVGVKDERKPLVSKLLDAHPPMN